MSDSLQSRGLCSPCNSLAQNIPKPGIKPRSPALQADSLPAEPQGKARPRGVSAKPTPLCVFILPSSSYLPSSPSCSFLLFLILLFFLPLPANRRNKTYHQMTEKRHQSVSSVAPGKNKITNIRVRLFVTPWTAAHQASQSITNCLSLLKLISITSVMPSNCLTLCCPLLLPPSIFPSLRVFSNESVLHIRWPKYWSFSFSISPSNEHPGLISFRMDWLDLLAV